MIQRNKFADNCVHLHTEVSFLSSSLHQQQYVHEMIRHMFTAIQGVNMKATSNNKHYTMSHSTRHVEPGNM
jgi:hypothetical protein